MDPRSLERAWRAMWMRAIGRALPGPRVVDATKFDAAPLRTLFVRYERIGDMIMATGLIRVLAQASARGKIDVVANPTTAPVLEGNPYVGKVYTLDRGSRTSYVRLMRRLRRERYDVIVDGRINNPPIFTSTPMLMLAARAPYRIGVGGGNNDLIYNVRVQQYDRSVPYIEGSKALSMPFGVDPSAVDWQPEIFLSSEEYRRAESHWMKASELVKETSREDGGEFTRRLLVNLSASEKKRRWPDEKFVEVLTGIRGIAPRMPIITIGLPSEWDRVKGSAESVRALPVQTPKLRDALALVGTSDMVFTPDTSISHAASAFRKPAVVLLKREHHPYAPYNIPGENIFWDGNEIKDLSVETVGNAVERLVRANPG
ncbi:MAG: glycosyltransferase family 9 protein [Gemmatimonadaceae bacterium]